MGLMLWCCMQCTFFSDQWLHVTARRSVSEERTIMCGRTACTLDPDQISTACMYNSKSGIKKKPRWTKLSDKHGSYKPSPNIGPKTFTPVLVSPHRFDKKVNFDENDDRILCEMQWGLIPCWHKGAEDSFKFNMINCRAETLLQKASFKGPLERGQRCVVLAEGYYEWQASKSGKKQPFFLQFNPDGPKSIGKEGDDKQDNCGKTLLKMAALYDKWYSPDSKEPLYTYSIITVSASDSLSWLHERMPVILEKDDDVCHWLDNQDIPATKAFQMLKSVKCLGWFPVSTLVNSIRNKSLDCMKRIDLDANGNPVQRSASSKLMSAWVRKTPRKHDDENDVKIDDKKQKLE